MFPESKNIHSQKSYRQFWDNYGEFPHAILTLRNGQLLPMSLKFTRITLWPAIFEIQAILRQVNQMAPPNTKRSNASHVDITTTPDSQIQ